MIAWGLTVVEACGANHTVTSLADSGPGTLRDTVEAAASGDSVDFNVPLPATITLTSAQILILNKHLTINGPGADQLTVTRSTAPGTPAFRIFYVVSDGGNVLIQGLTLANGRAEGGGSARDGGCIYSYIANVTVRGCTLTGNSAAGSGGAVFATTLFEKGVNTTVEDSLLIGNGAGSGGAIYNYGDGNMIDSPNAVLIVRNSRFTSNSAGSGGAILCLALSPAITTTTVTGCTFDGNTGSNPGFGGAIYNSGGPLTLTSSTIFANSTEGGSGGHGGGIYNTTNRNLTVRNCTFSGNSALVGGGIWNSGILNIGSTIFKSGDLGSNLFNTGAGTITSAGHNLSTDAGSGFLTATGDQVNTDPKLDAAGPLDHGGPTPVIALTSGSPAMDKGKSFGQTTDQRGFARTVNLPAIPPATGGDNTDIGAYEHGGGDALQTGPDLFVNTTADHDDGLCGAADATLREAIARANALPGENTIYFSVTGTITLLHGPVTISGDIHISGPGARLLAVSGNNAHRVFNFLTGGSSTLSGVTIRDGREAGAPGESSPRRGGGMYVHPETWLTISDCIFTNNAALGGNATVPGRTGNAGQGGAIYNEGSLTLNRCSLIPAGAGGNRAAGGAGGNIFGFPNTGGTGGAGQGGAIFCASTASASLRLDQCTLAGNSASGGAGGNSHFGGRGGAGSGGAVFYSSRIFRDVTACTISGNSGTGGAGGDGSGDINNGARGAASGGFEVSEGSRVSLRSTLCAGNTGNAGFASDFAGASGSLGYNLIGNADTTSGLTVTDLRGTAAAPLDARLGPIQNNGGPIDTMALLPDSPAVDRGKSFDFTTDQRGAARPVDALYISNAAGGDGADIGAVEMDAIQRGSAQLVTTLDDHDDGAATVLDTSLREAITLANSDPEENVILFAPGLTGTITLSASLGTLDIAGPVMIVGPGARNLAVSGGNTMRVFRFNNDIGTSHLTGLTIRNGSILGVTSDGAGLSNLLGHLTVTDCAFLSNAATGLAGSQPGQAGASARGAAVFNQGTLVLARCSFSGNAARGGNSLGSNQQLAFGPAGGGGLGGAIYNDSGAILETSNCSFFSNTGTGGNGANNTGAGARGGNGGAGIAGIWNAGTMTVTSCTLNGNTGTAGAAGTGGTGGGTGAACGGLATLSGGASTVRNTISASNSFTTGSSTSGHDAFGAFISQGYNLIGRNNGSTGFTHASDQTGTNASPLNAQLGSFLNNGGPTDTFVPFSNSPAIDKGKSFSLPTDQRNLPRTYDDPAIAAASGGDSTDIGAVELAPAYSGPLKILSITRFGQAIQIVVQGNPSDSYALQRSETLIPPFLTMGTAQVTDILGQTTFIDAGPLLPRRFYRVSDAP